MSITNEYCNDEWQVKSVSKSKKNVKHLRMTFDTKVGQI